MGVEDWCAGRSFDWSIVCIVSLAVISTCRIVCDCDCVLCVYCLHMGLVWIEKECFCGFGCERGVLLCVFGVLSIASSGCVIGWAGLAKVESAAFFGWTRGSE
jgi:hypothetical protein